MKKILVFCAVVICTMSAFAQSAETKPVDCGGGVIITATSEEGFHFVQWNDGNTEASRKITNIKEAKTFTAIFAADETTVDPSIDLGGVTLPVAHGTVLSLVPHTDDECEKFDHWSDITDPNDPDYAANPRSFTYNGIAPDFKAVFTPREISVTVNVAEEGQGSVTIEIVEDEE